MTMKLLNPLFSIALIILSCAAHAALPDEIQVYDGEISDPGEFSIDIHANYSITGNKTPEFQSERTSQHSFRITPEFNYGVSKTVELGLYIPTIYTPQYGYESAGYKFRVKWLPIQNSETQPWAAGLNIEYATLKSGMEESRNHIEYRFVLAHEGSNYEWAINPVLGSDLSAGYSKTPHFNYYASLLKKSSGSLHRFGLEYYQYTGPYNNSFPGNQQAKSLFAVANISPTSGPFHEWNFHVGLGKGWNTADPWMIKLIISPKLH